MMCLRELCIFVNQDLRNRLRLQMVQECIEDIINILTANMQRGIVLNHGTTGAHGQPAEEAKTYKLYSNVSGTLTILSSEVNNVCDDKYAYNSATLSYKEYEDLYKAMR